MLTLSYPICLLAAIILCAYGESHDVDSDIYLKQFGYMEEKATRSGNPATRAAARTRAIESFQTFAHLPVTGELDEQTKAKMLAPRCGMPDFNKRKITRAMVSSTWEKDLITWKLVKGTSQMDSGKIRKAIKDSFAVWTKVIPLNFTEVAQNAKADMQFDFGAADHGCGFKFDGQGNVLAHAFYPPSGQLHYDDEEQWTFENAKQIKDGGYTDLLSVTIHEIGHSLGLPHLDQEEAIMFPFYRHPELDAKGNIVPFVLNKYDIAAIQEAYGPRDRPATTPEPTPTPLPPASAGACPRFQAALTGPDNATYFFNGNMGWKKPEGPRGAPNSGQRFFLERRFPKGPTSVTTAFADKSAGRVYLFQGRRVWSFVYRSRVQQFNLEEGFPKDLTSAVPFTPDGAFQMSTGQIILYSGADFVMWTGSSNEVTFTNKLDNYFGTFPAKASFAYDDKLYFVDDKQVYIYDTQAKKTLSTSPMKTMLTC